MTDMLAGFTPSLLLGAALVLYRCKGWFGYIGALLSVAESSRNAVHFQLLNESCRLASCRQQIM
ncbi:hypothetical protein GCM10009720_16590 [Yaniella flava]|uniref:Uncharacterized protein n=2 Tax=Yaniella flava TaxID=287930 RepID=A0ABP5G0V8_9MICC